MVPVTHVFCARPRCPIHSSIRKATGGALKALVKMQGLILRLKTLLAVNWQLLAGKAPGQYSYNPHSHCREVTKSKGRNPTLRKTCLVPSTRVQLFSTLCIHLILCTVSTKLLQIGSLYSHRSIDIQQRYK